MRLEPAAWNRSVRPESRSTGRTPHRSLRRPKIRRGQGNARTLTPGRGEGTWRPFLRNRFRKIRYSMPSPKVPTRLSRLTTWRRTARSPYSQSVPSMVTTMALLFFSLFSLFSLFSESEGIPGGRGCRAERGIVSARVVDSDRRQARWSSARSSFFIRGIACMARLGFSFLDKRLQPSQRLVPLPGDEVEGAPGSIERLRLERKAVLAPPANAPHQP